MRVPREDIKSWWKNKQAEALAIEKDLVFYAYTDGGKVTRTSTDLDEAIEWGDAYTEGFIAGVEDGIDLAKDLIYHVYGLEPKSSIWNGLGKRGK